MIMIWGLRRKAKSFSALIRTTNNAFLPSPNESGQNQIVSEKHE